MKPHPFFRTTRLFEKKRLRVTIYILVLAISVFIPPTVVLANAAPPPTRIWIGFYDQQGKPTLPEGFQIIECRDENCSEPALLDQYGECNGDICLKMPISHDLEQPLDCSQNKCFMMVFYQHDCFYKSIWNSCYTKIIGQFRGEYISSNLLRNDDISGSTLGWQVTVVDKQLKLIEVEREGENLHPLREQFAKDFNNFIATFGITLVMETFIAGVVFWLKRIRNETLWLGVGIVALVNLISYPTTWFLLPVLGNFQPLAQRNIGIIFLIATGVCATLLGSITFVKEKNRQKLVTLIAVTLSICFICSGSILMMSTILGNGYAIAVRGLPTNQVILLSEIFAIVFEGIMVFLLLRKSVNLSLVQAFLLSFVMNSVSYLVGLWIFGLPFTLFNFA